MWDAGVPGEDCNARRHGDGPQRQSIPKSDACDTGCRHRGLQATFFQADGWFHVLIVVCPKRRSTLPKFKRYLRRSRHLFHPSKGVVRSLSGAR